MLVPPHPRSMMSASRGSNAHFPFALPQISRDDLAAFHESHFAEGAITDFGQTFINPTAAPESHENPNFDEGDEDEDDLGYYEDGVKRTLTDVQIEIFRHSELRELRRQEEQALNAKTNTSTNSTVVNSQQQETGRPPGFRSKKKKKKKPTKQEPKPDLRKRTWDVVEAGLDSLDYD